MISMFACAKEKGFVEKINTAVATTESPTLYGEVLNIDDGKNMVFIFDPTCSVCLVEYKSLCKYAVQCDYDSLTTIVINSDDMLVADFYLEKAKICHPKHENVIYDTKNEIIHTLYRLSAGRNVMLFENRKLIFSCNMQEYMFNDKK